MFQNGFNNFQSIFQGRLHIIRPFAYIREELIKKYAKEKGLLSIKKVLRELEGEHQNVRDNVYKALRHVKLDYLPKGMRDMK